MANTYTWIISQMNCYPSVDNLNDVIFCIHWRRSATTIVNEKEYYTDIYGAFTCEQPNPQDFTPYNDITYDQVCGWLNAGLPVAEMDASLDVALENLINPPVVTLPLPFENPTLNA